MTDTFARKTYLILKRTFPQYNKYSLDCLSERLILAIDTARKRLAVPYGTQSGRYLAAAGGNEII